MREMKIYGEQCRKKKREKRAKACGQWKSNTLLRREKHFIAAIGIEENGNSGVFYEDTR